MELSIGTPREAKQDHQMATKFRWKSLIHSIEEACPEPPQALPFAFQGHGDRGLRCFKNAFITRQKTLRNNGKAWHTLRAVLDEDGVQVRDDRGHHFEVLRHAPEERIVTEVSEEEFD